MGRQINFFMMPDDIRELDAKIKEMGLIAIESEMPTSEIVQLQSLLEGTLSKKLIISPEYLKGLNPKYYEKFQKYIINDSDASLIEFRRPYLKADEKMMKTGRLYYTIEFLNENNEFVEKPEPFIKTSEKLFRWYKSHFKNVKINSWFTTPRTSDWVKFENGKLFTNYSTQAS